ncbi:MAG: polyphosphate polymerase domain-containing protein [Planctomycetota bacterium]
MIPACTLRPEPRAQAQVGNRFELKFAVPSDRVGALLDELGPYLDRDPHASATGYSVHSTYWDSPDLGCFWEKVDGQKYRRKVRFRRYRPGRHGFLEIKQRIDRSVQKRRVPITIERVRQVLGDRCESASDPVLHPVEQEAQFLCRHFALGPSFDVAYRRRAYFARVEPALRVTFDTRLHYEPQRGEGVEEDASFECSKTLLEPSLTLMEVKFNHRVPIWLTKKIGVFGLRLVRFSKYCAAVDRELFDGRHT